MYQYLELLRYIAPVNSSFILTNDHSLPQNDLHVIYFYDQKSDRIHRKAGIKPHGQPLTCLSQLQQTTC